MPNRHVFAAVVGLGLVASAGAARAEVGDQGAVVISADRLSPLLSYTKSTEDTTNGSASESQTNFSLLWSGATAQDFYDVPKLALDYGVAAHITLGAFLAATLPLSHSTTQTQGNGSAETDQPKTTALGFGVRGGYAMALTPKVSFWGRLGLSYGRLTTDDPGGNDASSTYSQFALNLEPLMAFSLAPHFGLLAGLAFDVPLTGNHHQEGTIGNTTFSQDNDFSQLHIGATLGLYGVL